MEIFQYILAACFALHLLKKYIVPEAALMPMEKCAPVIYPVSACSIDFMYHIIGEPTTYLFPSTYYPCSLTGAGWSVYRYSI